MDYVMGILADSNGKPRSGDTSSHNSGFTGMLSNGTTYTGIPFPDSKYYNLYTGYSYKGHALTETASWYGDSAAFGTKMVPWFRRSHSYSYSTKAGAFNFLGGSGLSNEYHSSRFVITNE